MTTMAPRPAARSDHAPLAAAGLVVARWALFLILSGFLLFAHGCHGDEDNELFAVVRALRKPASPNADRVILHTKGR